MHTTFENAASDELKAVFDELTRRTEEEQKHFAHLIREELEAEQAWERAFADPRSPKALERMAEEARREQDSRKRSRWSPSYTKDTP